MLRVLLCVAALAAWCGATELLVVAGTPTSLQAATATASVLVTYGGHAVLRAEDGATPAAETGLSVVRRLPHNSSAASRRVLLGYQPMNATGWAAGKERKADTSADAWCAAVRAAAAKRGCSVLHSGGAVVLVEAAAEARADASAHPYPRNTQVLPLLSSPARPTAEKALARISAIAAERKARLAHDPDPLVTRLLDTIEIDRLTGFVDEVTSYTADPPRWTTRNSYSTGAQNAAVFLREEYASFGFNATLQEYPSNNPGLPMAPNVVAELKSIANPNSWVIIGGHYDSRGRSSVDPTEIAPGANDNGSSQAMLLELARVIKFWGQTFEYSLMIVSFCGEEQGLVGSRALAGRLQEEGADIVAMVASDMIAYRADGREVQIGYPDQQHTPVLTDLAVEIIREYLPAVQTCVYTGCCTDNAAFNELGFINTRFFEACGNLDDPEYHTPEDVMVRPGYDIAGELVNATKGIHALAYTLLKPADTKRMH